MATGDSMKESLLKRSPLVIFGTLALVLVVGGVAAFGIGYKVGEDRAKPAKKAATTPKKKATAKATQVRETGKIVSATPKLLTLKTSKGKTVKIVIGPSTTIVKASAGSASNVVKGSRIVYNTKKGTLNEAQEVVVLASNAKMGTPATAVTPTSVTFKGAKGAVTVKTNGAKIQKTAKGAAGDLKKDSTVVVQAARGAKGTAAIEIIVLPAGTTFA